MLKEGTTFVEVRALTANQPMTSAAPAGALYVQAGAFGSEANAAKLVEQLRTQGVDKSFVRRDDVNGQPLFRVRVGPIPTVRDFDQVLARLKGFGIGDAHLALD
jgi:rare lipoprotein A